MSRGKESKRPEGYITRAEFARAVKRGKTTIRRWEEAGKVTPTISPDGVRLYRVEDAERMNGGAPVESLARARPYVPTADTAPGEIGAAVFERLTKGETKVQIVCALKSVHPDIIEGFCLRYERMSGGMFLDAQQTGSLRHYLRVRPDAEGATIVARVARWAADRACTSCQSAVAHHCNACFENHGRQSAEEVQTRWEAYYASSGGRSGGHRTASTTYLPDDAQGPYEHESAMAGERVRRRQKTANTPGTTRETAAANWGADVPAPQATAKGCGGAVPTAAPPTEATPNAQPTPTPERTAHARQHPTAEAPGAAAADADAAARRRVDEMQQQPPLPRTPQELRQWLEHMKASAHGHGAVGIVPLASSIDTTVLQPTATVTETQTTASGAAESAPLTTAAGDDRTKIASPPNSTSDEKREAPFDPDRVNAEQTMSARVFALKAETEASETTASAPTRPASPEREATNDARSVLAVTKPADGGARAVVDSRTGLVSAGASDPLSLPRLRSVDDEGLQPDSRSASDDAATPTPKT